MSGIMSGNNNLIINNIVDGVKRITLNDIPRRNALSESMIVQLISSLEQAALNPSVRVIIISSKGSVFCSGHDLKEITNARAEADHGKAFFIKLMALCSKLMQTIVTCPKPVIAEVSGVATAAGCQLVASCDLAYAAKEAKFCTPGVNIGLFCSTPMVAVSRSISQKNSMEMLLTGDMISAVRAEEIGLINRSAPMKDLEATVTLIAKKIASKSSLTVKTGKKAFYAQKEMDLAQAYEHTSKVMVENLFYEDAQEGISAFLEKRDPDWSDR